MNEKKVQIFLDNNFKYSGIFIAEDSETYTIDDFKEGRVRVPKSRAVLKEERK